MAEWQMCPVCNGVGQVSVGYFTRAGDCNQWASHSVLEVCRICEGKGLIIKPEEAKNETVGTD